MKASECIYWCSYYYIHMYINIYIYAFNIHIKYAYCIYILLFIIN